MCDMTVFCACLFFTRNSKPKMTTRLEEQRGGKGERGGEMCEPTKNEEANRRNIKQI